ncbi:Abortive infection protein [Halothece sp. PCC 7418]|uniref:CPBP family intramembrane glutamic endopeptidase n=1 Tax=Halothece sp. (strain PCC 7418) TaxID=65093 RepID=UPI0002A078A1|nr:type II CAAX endopeptidase family protein [Halothece sp. PCC 7418]AFZ44569.1 Abortive infection protein [Halothece sp. PCC 7418]
MKTRLTQIQSSPAPIRIILFLSLLLFFWIPVAIPVQLYFNENPNLVSILVMGWLFILFFILIKVIGQIIYQQSHPYQNLGLVRSSRNGKELLRGLSLGLVLTFSLFILQGAIGWLNWQDNTLPLWRLILEGALTGIGVAFAEESVFRGWLLNELEQDYSLRIALWASGIIFAVSHFLKPLPVMLETLPAFPGLLLLGLVLVWARRRNQGRLGLAIGLHGGLVWGYYIVDVGQLITYTETVSPAITGIYGNPIAGVMGWLFLLGLAVGLQPKKN